MPAGLKGDQIPRSAQVSAICDVYSALTLPHAEALKTMASEAKEGAFNLDLFRGFEELINITKGN
jgi:HD-GYP domain-containing protein (c-di-GMP phosphodiesterase class II)